MTRPEAMLVRCYALLVGLRHASIPSKNDLEVRELRQDLADYFDEHSREVEVGRYACSTAPPLLDTVEQSECEEAEEDGEV